MLAAEAPHHKIKRLRVIAKVGQYAESMEWHHNDVITNAHEWSGLPELRWDSET